MEMKIYSENEKNKYKTIINPSLKDVIPLVQIGDVLAFTGHIILIYDVETDINGKVKDAIIIESTPGGGGYANSKYERIILSNNRAFSGSFLCLSSKINTLFKPIQIEGTVGLKRLSEYKTWINLNNTK